MFQSHAKTCKNFPLDRFKQPALFSGFVPLLFLTPLVVFGLRDVLPAYCFMWVLSGAVFFCLKYLTYQQADKRGVNFKAKFLYLFLWVGLNAKAFFDRGTVVDRPKGKAFLVPVVQIVLGFMLLFILPGWTGDEYAYMTALMGTTGILLMLHFGLFHVLALVFQRFGYDAQPLMNRPLSGKNAGEFWGKRWNTAFRDLTHQHLFTRLVPVLGGKWAMMMIFLVSGLVHDLVISLPAGSGYGLPTLFFMIQGCVLLLQRTKLFKKFGFHRGLRGQVFMLLMLVVTLPLIFHPGFAHVVIIPLLEALGALL